jgi:hypothetical protein
MSAIANGAMITNPRRAILLARIIAKAKRTPPRAAAATPAIGISPKPSTGDGSSCYCERRRMSPVVVGLIEAVEAKGAVIKSLAPSPKTLTTSMAILIKDQERLAATNAKTARGIIFFRS